MKKFNFEEKTITKYSDFWNITEPLIDKFEKVDLLSLNEHEKVIYGLTERAISIFHAIGELHNFTLIDAKLILTRSLFDTEILINWLLQDDSEKRIGLYLDGVELDKDNLVKKIKSKISTTGQVLADIFSDEIEKHISTTSKRKNWSGKNIRELTRDVYLEKSYDIGYWMMSVFVHGSALSIADNCKLDKYKNEKLLSAVFETTDKSSMAWSLTLQYPTISILNIFKHIDSYLKLNQVSEIDKCWKGYQTIINKDNKGVQQIILSDDKEIEGDFIVISSEEDKCSKKVYQSNDFKRKRNLKK